MSKVLNNTYHLQKQAENLKQISERQPKSPEQLRAQVQKLRMNTSEKSLMTDKPKS